MAQHIYGIHDFSPKWADLIPQMGATGWAVYTHALGTDPNDQTGHDYREATQRNVTPLARLNVGYGTAGTIPLPADYGRTAQRFANFVANSVDCHHWIIGNEIAMRWDWPNNQPITLEGYVTFYRMARQMIKAVQPDAKVIPQPPAPWNIELRYPANPMGDWVQQLTDMLNMIGRSEVDGIAIHTYSRGYNPADLGRDTRMNEPYQHRQSGFRSYRDYMAAVPLACRDLPVFITETNGDSPWNNYQAGWVEGVYKEIDEWNQEPGNQQIHALCLFRWAEHDTKWDLSKNGAALEGFRRALAQKYAWREGAHQEIETQLQANWLAVTTSYVNLRAVAGKGGEVLRVLDPGTVVRLLGDPVCADGLIWWHVDSGWIAEAANGVTLLTHYDDSGWGGALRFALKWEGGQSWDKNDPGNYTGCQVGEGLFKGTKYGISACSYPHLDIPNLTLDEVTAIYRTDFWEKIDGDSLPHPLALYAFDTAVNLGLGVAKELLDLCDGDATRFNELRRARYRAIAGKYPAMGRYLNVWLSRVADSERSAGTTRSISQEIRRLRRRRDGVCG